MVNINLSILLLTHKRPKLFQRSLESVLPYLTPEIEVIVNNDSSDIQEIQNSNIKYNYRKFSNISSVYEFLFTNSKGKYIYFLEDDDYLRKEFFEQNLDADIISGNYCPTYKPDNFFELINLFKNEITYDKKTFLSRLNLEHLQLGQFIFKRDLIEDFSFGKDNNVHNDIRMVYHASQKSNKFRMTSKVFYYQTKDGNDNISFPGTKKSIKVTASLDFLKNYAI